MINEGDSRLQHGMRKDVIDQRSRHDTLIIEEVRNGKRTIPLRVRVASDAKLRNSLTSDQEIAYDAIARAYNIIVSGLGLRATDYSAATGKGLAGVERGAELMVEYWEWRDTCKQRYISAKMAVEVIVDGKSLRQVEIDHKMIEGTAKSNLLKALGVWCSLVGKAREIPEEDEGFLGRLKILYGALWA